MSDLLTEGERNLPESATRPKKEPHPKVAEIRPVLPDKVAVHREPEKPKPKPFDPQEMARGLIEGVVYPIQPAQNELGARFNPADPEGYKIQVEGRGLKFIDPNTGEEIAKMPFRSSNYVQDKKYETRRDGPYNVFIDPATKREVMRYPIVAGGSGEPEFPAGWDLPRLQKHIEEKIEHYEGNQHLLSVDIISDLAAKITSYDPDHITSKERSEVVKNLQARLFLAVIDSNLNKGAVDKFGELMWTWSNEYFKKIWETERVKDAVPLLEYHEGAYFRSGFSKDEMTAALLGGRDPERMLQPAIDVLKANSKIAVELLEGKDLQNMPQQEIDVLMDGSELVRKLLEGKDLQNMTKQEIDALKAEVDWEKAKLSVDLAIRLHNITGVTSYYAGPVDGRGELIEPSVADKVFGIGNMVDMRKDAYWNEWDQLRKDGVGTIPNAPNGHRLPVGLGIIYEPENLQKQPAMANGLKRICELRVRSLAYFKGVRTLTELYGKIRPDGNDDPKLLGGGDWGAWASMLKGASEVAAKLNKDDPQFLNAPLVGADRAKDKEGPQKYMGDILKPYAVVAAGLNYLTGYSYGELGSANEEPFKARAALLGKLLRYAGTKEGQNLLGLGGSKKWGDEEILVAIDTVQTARLIDEKWANVLRKGFGISGLGIRTEKIINETGKQIGGSLLDLFGIFKR